LSGDLVSFGSIKAAEPEPIAAFHVPNSVGTCEE
jgi:hypothetical protein